MSALFDRALASWRECREDYDLDLYARYIRAETETNGALLNAEGRRRGIDPMTLFMGTSARAARYASEELIEHWQRYPRMPFAEFERQWMEVER